MCHCVTGHWGSALTRAPNGASLSPKPPRHVRRDSGVSAGVWGGTARPIISDPPNGASLSPERPRYRKDSGVSAAVWGGTGSPTVLDILTGRP